MGIRDSGGFPACGGTSLTGTGGPCAGMMTGDEGLVCSADDPDDELPSTGDVGPGDGDECLTVLV